MLIEDLYRAPYWERELIPIIENGAKSIISDTKVLEMEVKDWQSSLVRARMIQGDAYYRNKTDIKNKLNALNDSSRSNMKIPHNFAKKLNDQKTGYLMSNQPTISSESEEFDKLLPDIFDRKLLKKIKGRAKEGINKGISYLYPYFNEKGEFKFKAFPSEQVKPFWVDNEHEEITSFLRIYEIDNYTKDGKKRITKVEYYHAAGINYYVMQDGELIPDALNEDIDYHFMYNGQGQLWERIPLIAFKYNEEEIPLINDIKDLIDNINTQASVNADLLADIPKLIYILENYGGADLEEFIDGLKKYLAIKIEEGGKVSKLQADIQTEAVEKDIKRSKDSIYEFGRGVDTNDKELGNASGVALKYRYSDLDLDCNNLEDEMQTAIEDMLWFITRALALQGKGDFTNEKVKFIFNRDIIINESEVIKDCQNSVGILDDKTVRENHPWYTAEVEERLKEQEVDPYQQPKVVDDDDKE